MSKMKKLIKVLRASQDVLDLMDASGVNVDRLIGISNSQGPQGRLIKGILGAAIGASGEFSDVDPDILAKEIEDFKPSPPKRLKKAPKPKRSKKVS
jgi:hypothetical protein